MASTATIATTASFNLEPLSLLPPDPAPLLLDDLANASPGVPDPVLFH